MSESNSDSNSKMNSDNSQSNVSENGPQETAAFILPLILFLVIASFSPNFAKLAEYAATDPDESLVGPAKMYFGIVAIQVLVACTLLVYFRRIYLRHFPLKISWLSVGVGAIGVVLWVGACELHLEAILFKAIGAESFINTRPGFNPFEHLQGTGMLTPFLVLRFTLLALLVPVVEELFLRGWLVRWIHDPNWEHVSLKGLSWTALLAPSAYGIMTHPSEALAAALWFGLVTWLMARTGNLWDCVVAHAVTNLLLGFYIVKFSAWQYW